jgi:hypothetical protein
MQVGEIVDGENTKEFLISASRDKSIMVWDIQEKADNDVDKEWGVPKKILKGIVLVCLIPRF